VPGVITGSRMRTCLGDATTTFKALLEGQSGVSPLRFYDAGKLNVSHAYQIDDGEVERPLRAVSWLAECVAGAIADAGIDPATQRVSAIVGTGLRELRGVERWACDGVDLDADDLHFAKAFPGIDDVITLAGACSASGYALALAQDMLDADEADAVVVAGVDATTESMFAMIGRVADEPTPEVRPFERTRKGVLLGEGAVAVVLQRDQGTGVRVLGVGLSCDAYHETAPDKAGIVAAMRDAYARAGVSHEDIDLVLAHATGTALNDPTEAAALTEVFGADGPPVTGIKGAIGHTSGGAALMSLLIAVESIRAGEVPAVHGLTDPIEQAAGLDLVIAEPRSTTGHIAQINAFGFGGVNAVCVIGVDQ
jgi:3-oxoacyl-[acyl-carrier-protein] synthase II